MPFLKHGIHFEENGLLVHYRSELVLQRKSWSRLGQVVPESHLPVGLLKLNEVVLRSLVNALYLAWHVRPQLLN